MYAPTNEQTESFAEVDELPTNVASARFSGETERNNPQLAHVFLRSVERKKDQTDQVLNGLYETATSALGKLGKMHDRVRKLEENRGTAGLGPRRQSPVHQLTNEEFLEELHDFHNIADCALGFDSFLLQPH